jgi:hypothetical protein
MRERHLPAVGALLAGGLAISLTASAEVAADAGTATNESWLTGPALADRDGEGRDWSIDVIPYLWLINLNGDVGIGPTGAVPVSQTFDSLRSNLEGAFAGYLDARWRRWHLLVDGSWAGLGSSVPPTFIGLSSVDVDVDLAFGTTGFAYELPLDLGFAWDVYLAARWWSLTTDVQLNPAFGAAQPLQTGASDSWGDVIVGTRLRYAITDHWRVNFVGDVGGGGAAVDWQLYGGLAYDFNRHVGLAAGYRILGVDYSNGGFLFDTTQQGLLLGLRLGF